MNLRNLLALTITLLLSRCASTINSTGSYASDNEISRVEIQCIAPVKLHKYSSKLCESLKSSIESTTRKVEINLISEMTPSLTEHTTEPDNNTLIFDISHERISVYNGSPTGSLMNIEARIGTKEEPFWAAKVQTYGNSLTGPRKPEKVTLEIMDQLKADGFNF